MEILISRLAVLFSSYGMPLFSGMLMTLSFPNIFYPDFFPPGAFIAWVCLVPLLMAIENEPPKGAFKKGYAAGLLFFLLSTAWINNIKPMGPGALPAWICLSAYLALYPALFCHVVQRGRGMGLRFEALWIPALWTLLEFLRERLLTGYPWLSLGSSQAHSSPLLPLAALSGVYGLHFCVAALNHSAWALLRRKRGAYAGLGLVAMLLGLRLFSPAQAPSTGTVKVAVLQGNVDQDQAWTEDYRHMMMTTYGAMMREAVDAGAKVLIWPESAFPGFFNQAGPEAQSLIQFSKKNRVDLIFGSTLAEGGDSYFNAAVHLDAFGNSEAYRKRHLVPFGEYIPFRAMLSPLDRMLRRFGMIDFQPGPDEQKGFKAASLELAPLICYESIYGELVRPSLRQANVMLVVTLDTWFGNSAAPRLHFLQSALRAVENGVWVARSAATGISGFISPDGKLSGILPLNQKGWTYQDIPVFEPKTRYRQWGPWFLWFCAATIAFCVIFSNLRLKSTLN